MNRGLHFEFDERKSRSNEEKHGISFHEAQQLWESDYLEARARTVGEPRWAVIGKVQDRLWTAIITKREDSIRIISVRRARNEEKELYEEKVETHIH